MMSSFKDRLDSYFMLSARGGTLKGELVAGFTTFATMSYVLAVHPFIMAQAGMDRAAMVTVTAVSAAAFTLLMALWARLPIALAPGMGVNAFFAYSLCLTMGIPWQASLGLVFWSGLLLLVLGATGVRQLILGAFPDSIKHALTAGIGIFIAGIGLKNAGLVIGAPAPVLVTLGQVGSPSVLLAVGGLVLTLVLFLRKIPGAIILGILAITVAGIFVPGSNEQPLTAWPSSPVATPAPIGDLWMALDFVYLFKNFGTALPLVFSLLFIDLFSSLVAMQAVCQRGGLVDKNGTMLAPRRALVTDGAAAAGGALLGTSTVIVYIESAAGVESGGRTGISGVVVALLFSLALFFGPLVLAIPPQATAPALILIGLLMFSELRLIDFSDLGKLAPAALCVISMPFTSITDGLALGLVAYVLTMPAIGRAREIPPFTYALGALFALYYVFAHHG